MDRSKLTFGQAEGATPLPRQLELKEVSNELIALLWYHFKSTIERDCYGGWLTDDSRWHNTLVAWYVLHEYKPIDELSLWGEDVLTYVKSILYSGNYIIVFDFIQFIARLNKPPTNYHALVSSSLTSCKAAYRLIDNTIVPVASKEEADTVTNAFQDTANTEANGARVHLQDAASNLTAGKYADSVRHSISAVESVARLLSKNAKTLGPALTELEKQGALHKALKEGFNKLYGFTSDEEGIRHALLDKDAANVDEADALYMMGACAAFVSYLLNKTK